MASRVGELFRDRRTELGLTREELASRTGYQNTQKGARRLERLEREGLGAPGLVAAAASILGLASQAVAEARAVDLARPVRQQAAAENERDARPMALHAVYVALGVAIDLELPPGLSEEAAIAYASEMWAKRRVRMCLSLGRGRSMWFLSDGSTRMSVAARSRWPHG